MIFKPQHSMLWDTYILPHAGRFYLFYLQNKKDYWDGYGLAVSDDLLHWTDLDTAIALGPNSGTGMVYRAKEQWILSYCKMAPGKPHHVCFARSDDLYHWEKLPETCDLYPDPAWYDAACPEQTSSRFGDLWIEQQPDGQYLGWLTASLAGGPIGANGVVGLARSSDGITWQALPPASDPCGMSWAELGAHVAFSGRHYLLVGSNSGLGRRFDPVNNTTGKAGGMYVLMADCAEGPYKLVDGDPLLLGCRNAPPNWAYVPTYYTRIFHHDGQVLLHHHWLPRQNFTDAWLSVCKVLREDAPGRLALYWWPGNDRLSGKTLFNLDQEQDRGWTIPRHYAYHTGQVAWNQEGLVLTTGSSMLAFHSTEDYMGGLVAEASLTLSTDGAAGILFGGTDQDDPNAVAGPACLCNTRGLVEFGIVKKGLCSPSFYPENQVPWPILTGQPVQLKILLRGEFIEVYIDGRLVHCYGFSTAVTRNIGLFSECGRVVVHAMTIHAFSL